MARAAAAEVCSVCPHQASCPAACRLPSAAAQVKLEGRIRRAEDIAGAFGEFKRQVALSSKFERSGRPLGEAALQQLEQKGGCAAAGLRTSGRGGSKSSQAETDLWAGLRGGVRMEELKGARAPATCMSRH